MRLGFKTEYRHLLLMRANQGRLGTQHRTHDINANLAPVTTMNIHLEYLYRDAANNKEWGDVVFANTEGLSAEEVASRAEPHLIDRLWFVADKVDLPGLFDYPYDPESGKR